MSSLFQKGNVPYVITGSWDIAPFVKAGIDFGVTTLPATSDGTPTKSMSTVNAIVISSYTKHCEPIPNLPEMSFVWTPYATEIVSVWDGVQTPEAALTKATEEYNAAVER